jgi:hypothetical protein
LGKFLQLILQLVVTLDASTGGLLLGWGFEEELVEVLREAWLGLFFTALLVIDINTQESLLLGSGEPGILARITFPAHRATFGKWPSCARNNPFPYLFECFPLSRPSFSYLGGREVLAGLRDYAEPTCLWF